MPSWTEILDSRSLSTSGGRGQASRTFHAADYANLAALNTSLGTTVGSVLVPAIGKRHPEFVGLICRDFTATPVSGHGTNLYVVTFSYSQQSSAVSTGATEDLTQPNEVGFLELTMSIRSEFVDAFRKGVDFPTNGQPTNDEDEVGGTPIDRAGTPVSIPRAVTEITLGEIVSDAPNVTAYEALTFTRNDSTFQGFGAGLLLYKGAQVRRIGANVYNVQHTFAASSDYHLLQVPVVDQDGDAIDTDDDNHADLVYWVQPFPTLSDFGTLSTNF